MNTNDLGYKLATLCDAQSSWSQSTFGLDTERGPVGALKHLEKEAVEAQKSPDDITEYADCFLLTIDAARRAGFSIESLVDAATKKQEVNRRRKWPEPQADVPVEHVKEGSTK